MNNIPIIITGTDTSIFAEWVIDDIVTPIAETATIEVRIISIDHLINYTDVITLDPNAAGANWPAGMIVIEIPGSATVDIKDYVHADLQVKVSPIDSLSKSDFSTVEIIKGNIP